MNLKWIARTSLVLLALFVLPPASANPLPEAPLNAETPISLTHAGQWLRPVAPNIGTSADGRIGLNRNYGTVSLVIPEASSQPLINTSSPPGISILASQSLTLPTQWLFDPGSRNEQDDNSNAICDPPERQNPHPCAVDPTQDCYDLTIVHSAKYTDQNGSNHVHLWGADVRVSVKDPKTERAKLNTLKALSRPVAGPDLVNVSNIFEPSITQDGRFIVVSFGQQGGKLFTWNNNATGIQTSGTYNIMYAYNSERPACDVTGWSHDFAPVTHAHWDPALKAEPSYKVKFAQFALRDPEGRPLPDGVDLGAVYPWIDRSGANLFFSEVEQNLFYPSKNSVRIQYQVTGCVAGSDCILPEQMSLDPKSANYFSRFDERRNTRGLTIAGLWTHGKEVLIDATLNNTDYGIYGPDNLHYEVQLYSGVHATEIGTGRDAEGPPSNWQSSQASPPPKFYTRNTTIVDSFTNLFNYDLFTMKPNSVRDVAWTVNMGKASSTVSFDDFIDPDVLINADMNASLSFPSHTVAERLPVLDYHNGFSFDHVHNLQGGANKDIHLQNAATGTKWNSPRFGTVTTGTIRIEPVALGGKTGKGLWLDGNSGFQFAIEKQPTPVRSVPWYVGLWWDNRTLDSKERRLLTFPDHSAINVQSNMLKFFGPASDQPLHTTRLPSFGNRNWVHLALAIDARGPTEKIQVFLNGFHFDTWTASEPSLILDVGALQVGAVAGMEGIRGWLDDVQVIARIPDLETICNHAGGTLMGLDPGVAPAWAAIADTYPPSSHDEIAALISTSKENTNPKYVCYSDAKSDSGTDINSALADRFAQSSHLHSVRERIHFPEGPLQYDRPRPDSTRNTYCLSCHQSVQQNTALTLSALALNPGLIMSDDPRRQPFQSPPLIFGNIPQGMFDSGLPTHNGQAPTDGFKVDSIVFPER